MCIFKGNSHDSDAVTARCLETAIQDTHCILVWYLNGELFHI